MYCDRISGLVPVVSTHVGEKLLASTEVRNMELQQLAEQEEWTCHMLHLNRFYHPDITVHDVASTGELVPVQENDD